jgi:hypothetical protein
MAPSSASQFRHFLPVPTLQKVVLLLLAAVLNTYLTLTKCISPFSGQGRLSTSVLLLTWVLVGEWQQGTTESQSANRLQPRRRQRNRPAMPLPYHTHFRPLLPVPATSSTPSRPCSATLQHSNNSSLLHRTLYTRPTLQPS